MYIQTTRSILALGSDDAVLVTRSVVVWESGGVFRVAGVIVEVDVSIIGRVVVLIFGGVVIIVDG